MKLYEIDQAVETFFTAAEIDEATGEVIYNEAALDALLMDQAAKRKAIALRIKNLEAFVSELKAEEANFEKRRKAAERDVDWMRGYLARSLNGENFETAEVSVKFRTNAAAATWAPANKDDLVAWLIANGFDALVETKTEVSIDKKALKAAMANGEEIPYVSLTRSTSMTIK